MNFRPTLSLLVLGFLIAAPAARADISGQPSAVCGGVLMTIDDLQKSIAQGFAPTGFTALTYYVDPNLDALAKQMNRFDPKEAKVAREKIAEFRARQNSPGVRTTATIFSGQGVSEFLKSATTGANQISAQANQGLALKKWVIAAYGLESVLSVAAIPRLLEMGSDQWWAVIPAALFAVQFGRPVVKALLRLKESPLQKFMVSEFTRLGTTSSDNGLHLFSMSAKSASDFKTVVSLEEGARSPWAQEVLVDSRPWGVTRVRRIIRGKNPFVIPRKKAQIDLIAMPYGTDGQRQIVVLTAEGF